MQQLIYFIVAIVIFAIVCYAIKWVCEQFQLPKPVLWVCGAVLLIILLLFLANQLGGGAIGFPVMR